MREESPDAEPERVHVLFDQLRTAVKFLEASQSRGDLAWRAGLIDIARDAFQIALDLLGNSPPLSPADRRLVHDRIAEFRTQSAVAETDVRNTLADQYGA